MSEPGNPSSNQRCQHGISRTAYPPCPFCEHDRQRAIAENFAAYIVGEHPGVARADDHNVSSFMIEFGGGKLSGDSSAPEAPLPERVGAIVNNMEERFTSGNSIPVERAHIKRDEWDAIVSELLTANSPAVETSVTHNTSARDSSACEQAWYSFANRDPAPTHKDCFHAGWVSGKGYARDLMRESAQETSAPKVTFPEDMPMSERIGDPRIDGKPEKTSAESDDDECYESH